MNINMKTLEQHVCYQGSAAPVIIRRRKSADSRWSIDAVHINEHGLRVTECVTGIDYCPFCGVKLTAHNFADALEAERYSDEYKAQRKEVSDDYNSNMDNCRLRGSTGGTEYGQH